MADTVIAAKIEADSSGAVNSVKNFKKELKEAQQEVTILAEKFGATSKEAVNAAKRAAELKDSIEDARSLVDAFNPDTKFRAFGAAINTVVGGFTALQGVMGLVGIESEETQKALLKVQSALAISQGISQLQEGVQTFKNLGAVIQSTTLFQKANAVATNLAAGAMRLFGVQTAATSTAMNVLKGAIVATGIGALVILLGVAAQAMGLFSDNTDDAAEAQARLKTELESANAALQGQMDFFSNEQKLEEARARRRGASEKEIFDIQQKYRRLNFAATSKAYEEIAAKDKEQGDKLLKQLNDLNTAGQVAQIDFETKELERRKASAEKFAAQAKEARQKQLQEAAEENKLRLGRFTASGGPGGGLQIDIPKTQEQIQIENEAAARRAARLEEAELQARAAESYAEFTRIHTENVNQRIANEQAEFDAKQSLANATVSVLGALSAAFGQNTKAGKIAALAEIAIGTATGFINALRIAQQSAQGTGPAAAFAFPIFYATQIAAVLGAVGRAKAVLGAGSGGGGGFSANVSAPAPLQPAKPQQTTTTLDQDSLNALGSATTRAFVLESDVSSNQERIRRLNRAARIG